MLLSYQVLYWAVVVVEVQQGENHIFWCGFRFHQDFCTGTVLGTVLAQRLAQSPAPNCRGEALIPFSLQNRRKSKAKKKKNKSQDKDIRFSAYNGM